MIEKRKVLAYVTRGQKLLVFDQPQSPAAGIQVPAGTMEDGETPEQAVLREAHEETGLTALRLSTFLGELRRDMRDFGKDELHHRFYFHVICEESTPETWEWLEPSPSERVKVFPFRFFWVDLPDGVPELIADHGAFIHLLRI